MRTRPTIPPPGSVAALLAVLSALALAACGSGGGAPNATSGGSSTSTSGTPSSEPSSSGTSTNATSGASSASTSGGPTGDRSPSSTSPGGTSNTSASANRYGSFTRASAAAAERHAEAVQAARHRALAKKAGKAAPFLVPIGDNSIPTFGQESSDSERGGAESDLRAYLEARATGDWAAACGQMATTVQKQLALLGGGEKSEGCAAAYAKLASRVPASARANPLTGSLAALRVKDTKAFALFYGPKHQQYMMPMVSEGGAWKVNQLEPIPWPIGS